MPFTEGSWQPMIRSAVFPTLWRALRSAAEQLPNEAVMQQRGCFQWCTCRSWKLEDGVGAVCGLTVTWTGRTGGDWVCSPEGLPCLGSVQRRGGCPFPPPNILTYVFPFSRWERAVWSGRAMASSVDLLGRCANWRGSKVSKDGADVGSDLLLEALHNDGGQCYGAVVIQAGDGRFLRYGDNSGRRSLWGHGLECHLALMTSEGLLF